jgi:hypothetical protein
MRDDWFQLSQDMRVRGALEPRGVKEAIRPEWLKGQDLRELERSNLHFELKPSHQPVAVDLIERPYPLWSDPLKQLLQTFAPRLIFRLAGLMDAEREQLYPYWFMVPPQLACLNEDSQFDSSGRLTRLKADADCLQTCVWPIVRAVDNRLHENVFLINLALAEAILRRDFTGLCMQRVEVATAEPML